LNNGGHRSNNGYNHNQFGISHYRGCYQICKLEGHSASHYNYHYICPDSNNSHNISTQFAGIHVFNLPAPIETSLDCVTPLWSSDTDTVNHMASHTNLVQQPTPFTSTSGVYVGNDDSLCISYTSNSSIKFGSKSLSLNGVLVVPQLKKNLISLVKLTKDNNYVFCLFSMRLCYKGFGNEVDTFEGTN